MSNYSNISSDMEESTSGENSNDLDLQKLFSDKNSLVFLSVGVLAVFLLLVGGLYWWVSKKSKGEVIFPAGVNYTGVDTPAPKQRPQYDYSKMSLDAKWSKFTSLKKQYTFDYPSEMNPLIFPNDANDSVTFDLSDLPPRSNLMTLLESISNYSSQYKGKQEEFVRNYWKFFGGLKNYKDMQPFTTEKGLAGWKVYFIRQNNSAGSDNYFFPVPGSDDKILHVNNIFPSEGQAIFLRILNSLELKK